MRHRLLFAILVALVIVPSAEAAQPSLLYAIDAAGPTVVRSGGDLRLSVPASAPTTWFSDRPQRLAGRINAKTLSDLWEASGFDVDPPNAAVILAGRGTSRTHVVELTEPRFKAGRVSFAMRNLPGAQEAGIVGRHAIELGRYGRAEVFIDDAVTAPPCTDPIIRIRFTCLATDNTRLGFNPHGSYVSIKACIASGSGPAEVVAWDGTVDDIGTACPTQSLTSLIPEVSQNLTLWVGAPPGTVVLLTGAPGQ